MRFKLLGLLEVSEGSRLIPLPRGKERALLAALLIRAGEPVSSDRLIDELWGERPPEHAAKTVQVYVSRLRKALGAERVATTPAGYVIHAGEEELDSREFERLAREGREAFEAGDAKLAAALLREAEALWRGPALADLRFEPFAQAEIRRLEELRAGARADLVDVRLARGEAEAVIAELEQLVAEQPLWERPRRQLMLALYRSGRQADALELYRRTRSLLAEELAIEPSPELQELERAILNQDPALAAPSRGLPLATARRGAALLVAGGIVVAAAAAVAAFGLTRSGQSGFRAASEGGSGVGNAIAAVGRDDSVSYTGVGTTPRAIAVGEGGVWVLNADDRTISRIDPETSAVRTFGTGRILTDLAVGEGGIWVGNGRESGALGNFVTTSVTRFDPRSTAPADTAVLPRRVPARRNAGEYLLAGANQIAVGAGAVWAVNPDLSVSRIDAATGKIVARVPIEAAAVAAGRSAVWALKAGLNGTGPEVALIDRRRNRVRTTYRLPADSLWGLAVGGGSAWVTDFDTGVLWRIRPKATPQPIDIGFGITSVAYGDGAVWVANFVTDELARVDLRTNEVVSRLPLAGTPAAVATDGETAWTSIAGARTSEVLPASECGAVEAGGRDPDVLIASDLPLQGPIGGVMRVGADAIRFVLRKHAFRAGPHTVGYQSCDDSTGQAGRSESVKCASNAKTYAATKRVVGLVGPFNSSCAAVQIPIANQADPALPMISPSNTHTGLTHRYPGSGDEPARFYPTGVRNYFRVTASDDLDGAADAVLADELGLRRIFVLRSDAGIGEETTVPFRRAARRVGIDVVGSATWHARAADYRSLAARVAAARPDGVFIGDEQDANGGEIVKALRGRLGSKVVLIAGDAFLPTEGLLAAAGRAAIGMYVTTPAVANEGLGPAGRRFVREFGRTQPGGIVPSALNVTEAAQAAEALLAAIARSDGTRASVLEELRRLEIRNGILGSFRFDNNGDMTPASFTVFRITGGRRRAPGLPEGFGGAVVDGVVRVQPALARPAQ